MTNSAVATPTATATAAAPFKGGKNNTTNPLNGSANARPKRNINSASAALKANFERETQDITYAIAQERKKLVKDHIHLI